MFWLVVFAVFAVVVGGIWFWERGKGHRIGGHDARTRGQVDRAAEQSFRQQPRDGFGGGGV